MKGCNRMKMHLKRFVCLALTIVMVCGLVPIAKVEAEAAESWLWPVANYTNWTTYENHRGIDIPAPSGTPIRAAKSGTLYVYNNTCNGSHYGASPACTVEGCNSDTGKCVFIIHSDGTASCYMHLVSLAVTYTKWVNQGDIIGYVGTTGPSTGNHLHFEAANGSGTNYWSYSLMNPGNLSYIYSLSVAPTGITASEKQFTMTVGESKTVTATVEPSNANNKNVTWASSDTSVATVSNGVIKAVSSGGATITATNSAGHKANIEVVVNPVNIVADGMIQHGGHTYEIIHSIMTWKQAKEYCEKRGGHLATITSKEENDAIYGLINKYGYEDYDVYFIGMTDEDSAGTYTWITGEDTSYENWLSDEPSNSYYVVCHEKYQNYGTIGKDGFWNDRNNYANVTFAKHGFICEYEKEFTYDKVTIIGDKVYELYEREYPITFADEFAKTKGGNLVSLTSEEDQTALIAWIQANSDIENISIGANDAETEGVWQWYNGEDWEFTSWVEGEPNDTNGIEDNAILILSSGKWNDVSGANAYSFVVEYDLDEWLDLGNDANDIVFNELPEGADPDDYEIVTEYRYRDKETKTSTESRLDGWELYDSETTYGTWSKVQSTKTKPTTSDTLQITGTWKQYHYYHYCNKYSDGNWYVDSIAYGTQSIRHDVYINFQLPASNVADQGGKQAYGSSALSPSYACDVCIEQWPAYEPFYTYFYNGATTFYNYQTRTKTTTNYFYKYGDWSDWSETPVTSTDNREVESRTVYVLKEHKHSYSDWVVETEVTCITDGLKSRTCTDCGDVETEIIPATGHQNTIWITEQEPNCTEDGYKDEYCLDCAELIDTESIPATGHLDTIWETKDEPTCDDAGCKEEYCLACGEKIGTEEIPATGHSYSTEWTIDTEPTCVEEGSKSHHCTVCGDKADVTVIISLGHEYKVVAKAEEHPHTISYKCSRCPETKEETSTSADCAICNFSYTNIDDETCKITGYIGNANSFVMPGTIDGRTVTTTTTGAFKNNTTLTSVRIENGVQGLGSLAFLGCTSLSKIVIPESVTSIGTNAFYNCADDFTIYCYRDTYAIQYAIDNSIDYVIMDVGETNNSIIDYKNELIYTFKKCITNLCDILNIPSTSMAFAEASHISGNKEFLGTGTKITVFDNDEISSEYTLVVDGDINGDSVCDVLDCAQVALASNGFAQISGAYLEAGDADDNGEIDVTDYQSIVNSALAG